MNLEFVRKYLTSQGNPFSESIMWSIRLNGWVRIISCFRIYYLFDVDTGELILAQNGLSLKDDLLTLEVAKSLGFTLEKVK